MSKQEYAIEVKNVSKVFMLPHEKRTSIKSMFINALRGRQSFERQRVLNDVSFSIKPGEFFGIVGRNGSGKSTMLKLLAGIYEPDQGSIRTRGKLTPFIELGVGFNPELTGKENIYLNGALLGFTRPEVEDMYDDIVRFAELERFMDQKLKNYSSGMQVRLAFAIAIRAETDILLIDEVLAVGDLKFQEKCFNFFKEIKGKKTVVFISHDMSSVEKFCDRVMILEKSEVIDTGKPQDMVYKYGALMAEEKFEITKGSESKKTGTHLGSKDVRITKVSLLVDGKPAQSVKERQPFGVRVEYDSDKDIPNVVANVSIFDDQGVKLFASNTEKAKITVPIKAGPGVLEVAVAENPFAPARYKINAGIFGENLTFAYDHFRDAGQFKVIGAGKGDARVILPSSWSQAADGKKLTKLSSEK